MIPIAIKSSPVSIISINFTTFIITATTIISIIKIIITIITVLPQSTLITMVTVVNPSFTTTIINFLVMVAIIIRYFNFINVHFNY